MDLADLPLQAVRMAANAPRELRRGKNGICRGRRTYAAWLVLQHRPQGHPIVPGYNVGLPPEEPDVLALLSRTQDGPVKNFASRHGGVQNDAVQHRQVSCVEPGQRRIPVLQLQSWLRGRPPTHPPVHPQASGVDEDDLLLWSMLHLRDCERSAKRTSPSGLVKAVHVECGADAESTRGERERWPFLVRDTISRWRGSSEQSQGGGFRLKAITDRATEATAAGCNAHIWRRRLAGRSKEGRGLPTWRGRHHGGSSGDQDCDGSCTRPLAERTNAVAMAGRGGDPDGGTSCPVAHHGRVGKGRCTVGDTVRDGRGWGGSRRGRRSRPCPSRRASRPTQPSLGGQKTSAAPPSRRRPGRGERGISIGGPRERNMAGSRFPVCQTSPSISQRRTWRSDGQEHQDRKDYWLNFLPNNHPACHEVYTGTPCYSVFIWGNESGRCCPMCQIWG